MNYRVIFKLIALSLTIALLFSTAILSSACKKESDTGIAEGSGAQESSISDNGSSKEASSNTSIADDSQSSGSTAANSGSAGQTTSQSVSETTAEVIPQEISDLITKADSYYASGEYALASKTYRDAEQAIKGSDLTDETQQLQLNLFAAKYKKAKEITDTARAHYGKAMSFQYEQRFEEAIKELEAALAIYPKYKDAIDLYDMLKTTKGLE